jgi:hypothetical protein
MTPSHVEVNRCDGGCFHHSQSCLPSKIQKKKIPVSPKPFVCPFSLTKQKKFCQLAT